MMQENITIIVNTLNDSARDLDKCFLSLKKNKPKNIIVVDGGSTDGTVEIAKKYFNSVFVTKPSIVGQHLFALKKVDTKYVLGVETDQELPNGLLAKLLQDIEEQKCFGSQAKLICKFERNFFEKGQKIFYEINQNTSNRFIDISTTPSLLDTQKYLPIIEELYNLSLGHNFAIDTFKAELLKKKNLKVFKSNHIAYQVEKLNLKIYIKKIISYGNGDYTFFNTNKKKWSIYRKLISLSHVFRRYVVVFPIKSIFRSNFLIAIPFFWLTAIVRYYAFLKNFLINKKI
tara:strand:- start:58 stop:918 length:861 start_codon:yes stop_codon:yes gene_type:complete